MSSFRTSCREARARWRRMDRLVRMVIVNWLGGMAVGLVCAFALLALDVAGVRSLLWRSDMPVAGTLMLAAVFAFTFGGLVCAAAVMMSGDDDRGPPRGGRKLRTAPRRQPAFAAAGARRSS